MFFATVLACTIQAPITCEFYLDYFFDDRKACRRSLESDAVDLVEQKLPEGYFVVGTECFSFGTLL